MPTSRLKPISPGQPVIHSARDRNEIVRLANNTGDPKTFAKAIAEARRSSGILIVKNESGEDVPDGGVLALSEPMGRSAALIDSVRPLRAGYGVLPSPGLHTRVAVPLRGVGDGESAPCVVDGYAAVRVKFHRVRDEFADFYRCSADPEDVLHMRSAPTGSARIVWVDPDAQPVQAGDVVWCIVRLGGDPAPFDARITDAEEIVPDQQWRYKWSHVRPGEAPDPLTAAPPWYGNESGGPDEGQHSDELDFGYAYNTDEAGNDGVGPEGHGVDIDGPSFPAGFATVPVRGGPVRELRFRVTDLGTVQVWFGKTNAVDGTCS